MLTAGQYDCAHDPAYRGCVHSLAVQRLGVALRWIRRTKSLSQRALGDALGGWSQAQVKKLENLDTPNPGVTHYEDVCKRFGVPWGYFHAAGPAEMDPGQYMASQPLEAQMEALRAQLEERIAVQVADAMKAHRAKAEPPTGPRRRTG